MSTMGRRRGGRFADRPENVRIDTQGGVTYFRYLMPDGSSRPIGTSRDKQQAYDTARALNGHFAQQRLGQQVAELIAPRPKFRESATNPLMPTLIDEFKVHDPKRKKYSKHSRDGLDIKLAQYKREWPNKTVKEMETTDFARFLNGVTDNAYVKHRPALHRLMQFAAHQGYRTDNPVAVTMEKEESEKVRLRHTLAGVQTILNFQGREAVAAADGQPGKPAVPPTPVWLKRAILIGLYSLQRAEDVLQLHKIKNKVNLEAGTLEILQNKTRNYKMPVYIEIAMGAELRAVVEECVRSDIPCPYLIHRRPDRITAKQRAAKLHPFSVERPYLSRGFAEARDNAGAYDHLLPEQRPTFHELRALGSHLYEKAGYDDEYIMALSGHAKPETLEKYKKDHADRIARRVDAGLSVGKLMRD